MPPLARRLAALRRALVRHRLDALLVGDAANVRYLAGFSGSAGYALVTSSSLDLILDARYYEQAAFEAPRASRVLAIGTHYEDAIAEALARRRARRVAFEADATSYASYLALTSAAPAVEWVPSRDLVELGRMVKDASEIACVRRAASITSAAVAEVLAALRPGMSEKAIADELACALRRLGGEKPAFEPLVATGPRGAWPHARPSEKAIAAGEWLLVDAGTTVGGYCADMTRTVYLGALPAAERAAWEAVHAALRAGLAAVKPGARACEIDARCREALAAHGFGTGFAHDAGHGVGLALHERPRLAPDDDEALESGMIVTVEPGLYRPGTGGIRLEELVLVTPSGAEVLTTAPLSPTPLSSLTETW